MRSKECSLGAHKHLTVRRRKAGKVSRANKRVVIKKEESLAVFIKESEVLGKTQRAGEVGMNATRFLRC